jgi:DNA polymerase III alpha subunit
MPKNSSFVHLHCHADGSMLDGLALVADLVPEVEKLGMPAIALTDHGSMAATYDLYKVAKNTNVKAIYGSEIYLAPDVPRTHKSAVKWSNGGEDDVSGGGAYTHMTLLAETNRGLKNLFAISSESYLTGMYKKPRADTDLLSQYSEGVIATSGCPSGEIQTLLRIGDYEKAKQSASKFVDIFGKDNFFIELMDHGLDIERRVIKDLIRLSKDLGLKTVATNDLHYVRKQDAKTHEALLCIQSGSLLSDPNRFKFDAEDFYLKTPQEMRAIWDEEVPDACDNTLLIAERCVATFEEGKNLMPKFPIPEGYTEETWFAEEVRRGLEKRYPNGIPEDRLKQAEYEIDVITQMGFPGYFLVVSDFINWAKENGIGVGPGRGCLSGDSLILTPQGFKEIKNIEIGDTVFDEAGNQVVVPAVYEYACDEPLVEIKTYYSGNGVKMTVDHKVLVSRPVENDDALNSRTPISSPEWIRADQITKNDYLVVPKIISQEIEETIELEDNDLNEKKSVKADYNSGLFLGSLLAQEIKKFHYSPDTLLNYPEEFRKGVLEGLWSIKGTDEPHANIFKTSSQQLSQIVYMLLLSLGLPAGIKSSEKTSSALDTIYYVTTVQSFDEKNILSDIAYPYDGNYIYYKVREINNVPAEEYVYDFTVPTTHSYVTDSYVVHNSAAGSLVAYAMNITELDPIKNGLIFERFLNPERVSPPDIDIDFDDQRRGEVIEYVIKKYGEDKVSHIGTFMKVKAKAAVKDSARVLGFPYSLGDKLTKIYPPPIVGRDLSLKDAYDPDNARYREAEEFRKAVELDPDATRVVELGKGLEGVKRGHGMHAAGVIMSSEPLIEHVPLMRRDVNAPVMTQFEYPTCENLGLIKMDFLGLSNLTTIQETIKLIQQNKQETIDLQAIWDELDDQKTFELLSQGDTLGVFQLDSGPIRSLLRLMNPDRFDDISAVLALYRPGPMGVNAHLDYADRKNNRKPIVPIHPELEEPLKDILEDSYGLIVYQEQVMSIAQRIAGYSLGQADLLRRAMGKKKKEILDKEFIPFEKAALENGYSKEAIKNLWEVLVPFSDYAFNRAHSAAYGYISYATAYFKANYPVEYMAGLLSTNASDKDKTALYLNECRQMGIEVLPPDVNSSVENYSAVGDTIRVGLVAVKNVGHGVVENILQARSLNGGSFKSFGDFLYACPPDVLKKRAIESLIKAGAFDSMGYSRSSLMLIHDNAIDAALAIKKSQKIGQDSLFAETDIDPGVEVIVPDIPEWDKTRKLAFEREMLGLYVSDHPLRGSEEVLAKTGDGNVSEVKEYSSGVSVKVAGLISGLERKKTKKGDPWAIFSLEDLSGSIPVFCFPKTYAEISGMLLEDAVVLVDGRFEVKDDSSVSIICSRIKPLDLLELADPDSVPIILQIPEEHITEEFIASLKKIADNSPGRSPVHLQIMKQDGTMSILKVSEELSLQRKPGLISELKEIAGFEGIVKY